MIYVFNVIFALVDSVEMEFVVGLACSNLIRAVGVIALEFDFTADFI